MNCKLLISSGQDGTYKFNEKLLVKQENENLQILDVWNSDVIEDCRSVEFRWRAGCIIRGPRDLLLQGQRLPSVGSINVGNILTGKCIAKICPLDPHLQIGRRKQGDTSGSTIKEALESVTALFYDEHRNEIYTGNKQGLVHVWSKPLFIGDNLQACL
ncbi:hypothetical protein OPV22_011317 [Ensete ventricosum]|uniref:Uncharacterized protein n=1 Tax=Ensete ventricosum TaxID=4639 RepID=A0AAV8Q511_ENSVE|nr:hypothetical protein OPV22_011317 [Ensete ventricosum]